MARRAMPSNVTELGSGTDVEPEGSTMIPESKTCELGLLGSKATRNCPFPGNTSSDVEAEPVKGVVPPIPLSRFRLVRLRSVVSVIDDNWSNEEKLIEVS